FISSPPLFHFAPEVRQQRVQVSETVALLCTQNVPMVALSRLDIVPQHTDSIDNERQPVFELVARSTSGPRQPPNDDLDERAGVQHMPFVDQQLGLHVGANNNMSKRCQ